MKVLAAIDFAKDNIALIQFPVSQGFDGHQLTGLNFTPHGIAPGPELHGFASFEFFDKMGRLAHNSIKYMDEINEKL
jgi:hypothetical protein